MKTVWPSVWGLTATLFCALTSPAVEPAAKLPPGYQLLYEQDFASATALKDFVFTDPKVWRISQYKNRASLELFGASDYQPAHRSPFNIALLADRIFGDFILEVELLSTVKPYGHQDMCLFLGMQEPLKFYYDDLTRPIMVAEDKSFASGGLGFGSFDDRGKIGNLKIWGPTMETKKTIFFTRLSD